MGKKKLGVVKPEPEMVPGFTSAVEPVSGAMSLGACVDKLYLLRAERLEMSKKVDAVKSEEEILRQYLLTNFKENDINGVKGKVASCGIIKQNYAKVEDWDKFYEYIRKHKAWDMLERRVAQVAYRARIDDGKAVPGLSTIEVTTLSLTKAGK